MPVPDYEAIKRNYEERCAKRVEAQMSRLGEWRRDKDRSEWLVFVRGRSEGDEVTVLAVSGRVSRVKLVRAVDDNLYSVQQVA